MYKIIYLPTAQEVDIPNFLNNSIPTIGHALNFIRYVPCYLSLSDKNPPFFSADKRVPYNRARISKHLLEVVGDNND